MENRNLQIDELLKRDLGDIILRETDFPKGCLVTLIKVKTSKDLKEANVYISVLPHFFTGKVLSLMRKRSKHFVYLLRKKVTIKYVPEIKFLIDNNVGSEDVEY